MSTKDKAAPAEQDLPPEQVKTCGLIMPISSLDGMPAEHWLEVRAILTDAVESIVDPKFTVRIVSDADETGIIQKRIVHNVYSSDIIVCDVSGKNPNVMFELGMRLAFDRPVVIVKDDKTDYSFDTGIIEHLTYPRDLRFSRIVEFKLALAAKVLATYKAASVADHSPFLKNFGRFHVASLSETEVSPEKMTLELLEEVRGEIRRLSRRVDAPTRRPPTESERVELENELRHYVQGYLAIRPRITADELFATPSFVSGALAATRSHEVVTNAREAKEFFETLRRLVDELSDTPR